MAPLYMNQIVDMQVLTCTIALAQLCLRPTPLNMQIRVQRLHASRASN